ncbi:MAG: hypothetical protein Fur0018_26560 [Anaerolineales bacterium]
MKTHFARAWRMLTALTLLLGLVAPAGGVQAAPSARPSASPLVDGVIDAAYGAPVAQDPAGDGNGNAPMDLLDLYVTSDAHSVVFTPDVAWTLGETYRVSVSGQTSAGGDVQQVPVAWTFQVGWKTLLPLIFR